MRPKLVDLFCCQGGASVGYSRAGFDPTGVDIVRQRRYPYASRQADVLAMTTDDLLGFDAAHASPKCQFITSLRHAPNAKQHDNQIPTTLRLLRASGLPWILENVPGAEPWMPGHIVLCGCMFDLGAQGCRLQRRRLFMASFPITAPRLCTCETDPRPVIGIYGGHARRRAASAGGRGTKDEWIGGHRAAATEAMDMHWATLGGMSEAIPPAYTEWLGRQLLAHLALTTSSQVAA